jgi:hypothetical protein
MISHGCALKRLPNACPFRSFNLQQDSNLALTPFSKIPSADHHTRSCLCCQPRIIYIRDSRRRAAPPSAHPTRTRPCHALHLLVPRRDAISTAAECIPRRDRPQADACAVPSGAAAAACVPGLGAAETVMGCGAGSGPPSAAWLDCCAGPRDLGGRPRGLPVPVEVPAELPAEPELSPCGCTVDRGQAPLQRVK